MLMMFAALHMRFVSYDVCRIRTLFGLRMFVDLLGLSVMTFVAFQYYVGRQL